MPARDVRYRGQKTPSSLFRFARDSHRPDARTISIDTQYYVYSNLRKSNVMKIDAVRRIRSEIDSALYELRSSKKAPALPDPSSHVATCIQLFITYITFGRHHLCYTFFSVRDGARLHAMKRRRNQLHFLLRCRGGIRV